MCKFPGTFVLDLDNSRQEPEAITATELFSGTFVPKELSFPVMLLISQNIGCVYGVYTAESLCSTERISVNFT